MATTRRTFTDDDSIADSIPHTPVAKRFACAAHECPMTGAIFGGNSHAGTCGYHYAANPIDWPRITQRLVEWQCVTDEINRCRAAHINPETATKPAVLEALFATAWARLAPLVPGWERDLQPQKGKGGYADSYRSWGQRLEEFIGGQVLAQHTTARRKAA